MIYNWLPVSPCSPDCKDRDGYCPPRGRFGCIEYKEYQAEIHAQRRLLAYQIRNFWSKDIIVQNILNEMLKQLNRSQDETKT